MAAEIVSLSPATGEVLGRVATATRDDVARALKESGGAQERWGALPPKERASRLREVLEALMARMEEVASLISREQGKTVVEAYCMEIFPALEGVDFAINGAWKVVSPKKVRPWTPVFASHSMETRYEPLGVVAVISPWNYPFAIPFLEILSALVAGNGVVLKPSPYTPLVGNLVTELFQVEALPRGLVQVVQGEGDVGEILVTHPGVAGVFFTGSVATGKKVYQAAAPGLKKVVLELGGKDPAIVLADAQLDYTVEGILWAAMANAGQTCASVEVVLAHDSIFRSLVDALVQKIQGFRVGDPLDEGVDMGPMSNQPQYEKVLAQLEEARKAGVDVVGGEAVEGRGLFIKPAVVVNPPRGLKVIEEETFGPVVCVVPFQEVEEAISLANSMPYGLTASVWTTNPSCGEEFSRHLRYGVVTVNDHLFTFAEPQLPWGGFRESGLGRSHGLPGLMELVEPKGVARTYRFAPRLWWYPYDRDLLAIMKGSMRGFFFPSLVTRWRELMTLPLKGRVRERVDLKDFMLKGALRIGRTLLGK